MKILFFTPINFRCRDVESLLVRLNSDGHEVTHLNLGPHGKMNEFLAKDGVTTISWGNAKTDNIFLMGLHALRLIVFCRRKKFDVLLSHLEPTNFISVMAQCFMRTHVVIFRHHTDLARLSKFDSTLTYKFTYRWAKKIITVSRAGRAYMEETEGIPTKKIWHINLGYDFARYALPADNYVAELRQQFGAKILLVSVGRLDSFKRPELSVKVLDYLVNVAGCDAKLLLIGTGSTEGIMHGKDALKQRVIHLGFVEDVLPYLAASDFLLHPSISESSSVVVKEAALVNLPVIACKNVGDYDDYLNSNNGFLVSVDNFLDEAAAIIKKYENNKAILKDKSARLKEAIISRFSIRNTIPQFYELFSSL